MGGVAGTDPNALAEDLGPLFESILNEVDPPQVVQQGPLQLLVTNLDYDEHKGRIAIGRVQSGAISKGAPVVFLKPGEEGGLGLCMCGRGGRGKGRCWML